MEKSKLDKTLKCNTIVYTIRWNTTKSARLKRIRGVSFEEIIQSEYLGLENNLSRDNQLIFVFRHNGYVWAVPFVLESQGVFLKTLYPSRKFYRIYKERKSHEKNKID